MENKPPTGPSKGYQKKIQKEEKPRPKPIARSTDYSSPTAKKWPEFVDALQNGKVDVVNRVIEEGMNVNTIRDDLTPLMIAVSKGQREVAELLFQSGANINEKNDQGWTALHKAAYEQQNAEIVQFLMESGSDINAKNKSNKTALQLAEEKHHQAVVASIKARLAKERVDAEEWQAFLNSPDGKPYKEQQRSEKFETLFKFWWLPLAVVGTVGIAIGVVTHTLVLCAAIGLGAGLAGSGFLFLWQQKIQAYLAKIGPLPYLDIEMLRQKRKSGEPILVPGNFTAALKEESDQPAPLESGTDAQATVIISPAKTTSIAAPTSKRINMKWMLYGALALLLVFCIGAIIGARESIAKWYYTKKLEHKGGNFSDQAFLTAVAKNSEEMTELFLKAGVNVNAKNEQGQSAVIVAAEQGHENILAMLLKRSVQHNHFDKNGNTALMAAAAQGRPRIVATLVEAGADVNFMVPGKEGPASALQTALDSTPFKKEHLDIVKYLLQHGANPKIKNTTGRFPLFFAAEHGLAEAGKLLLESGADVNESDFTGRSSLLVAACKGYAEFVSMLADKGAYMQMALPDGYTPLMCAAREGKAEAVKTLLAKGAPVDAKTNTSYTALTEATRAGDAAVAKLLLDQGADPTYGYVPDAFVSLTGKVLAFKAKNQKLTDVVKRIQTTASKDGYTITSAQSVDPKISFSMKAPWNKLLMELAKKNHLSVVVKDKEVFLIPYQAWQRSMKIEY